MAGRVTISELLRSALARTGYLATLTGLPDGDRRRGNVEKLLQLAAASNKVTLSAFTQHLGDLSAREVREGEADLEVENAVTLMTVHASKGLEFPLVVLVDTSWSARGGRGGRPLVNDPQYGPACKVYVTETDSHEEPFAYRMASMLAAGRDEAERRRLLYVAATRAADYLVISGQISRKKSGEVESGLWLGWLIEALDVGTAVENGESGRIRRNWGALDLWIGQQPPDPAALLGGERRPATAWTALPDRPRTSNPADPPLLAPLRADRAAVTRHLSVTQLDGLGTDVFYAQRFRRQVLHDAPAALGPALRDRRIGRLIGEMVHEVLRWCDPADVGDAERLLRAYAWENGITDAAEIEAAVGQAAQLLRDFATSDIARRLAGARHSYRELPFVLRTGQRILHGVLDLLIEEPDGIWTVIDYKTGYVADHQKGRAVFEAHARRYALQVGTYAEAVARRLGDDGSLDAFPVTVYIHYIRYGVTIALPRDAWRDELRKLEHIVGQLIE
jgi:ATP-dependent helicase/nuclease subunit A